MTPSWNAQAILQRLQEVHPALNISTLKVEFGGPIRDCPDSVANEAPVDDVRGGG